MFKETLRIMGYLDRYDNWDWDEIKFDAKCIGGAALFALVVIAITKGF